MNLNEFLIGMMNEAEDRQAAKQIPISSKIQGTSLVSKIKSSLQNSNLNNIELDTDQNEKAYVTNSNGEPSKTRVHSDVKLKLHCKNHDDKIPNKSVEELNAMITNYNQGKKTGTLNPCSIGNRYNKEGKLEPDEDENAEENVDEMPTEFKKFGSFDSKEEVFVYYTLKNYIKNIPALKGCKVWPLNNGYGKKFEFTDIDKVRDADVYLEYTPQISALLNGKKGLAFLVDGSTHYGVNVKNAVYTADEARGHSNENHVARVSVYDINDKSTGEAERKRIADWVKYNIDELVKHIPSDSKGIKAPEKTVRAYGEKKTGNVLRREEGKALKREMLERLIIHLKSRKSNAPFYDKEDDYHSNKYGGMKLSTFLTPNNEKNGYTGKMSYERYPHIWRQIMNAPSDKLHQWKEKHQAKNGERLFSGNSDEDRKLFENRPVR